MSGHEPWDDERLAAAWHDRASRVLTPTDLTDRTRAELRVVGNRRSTPSWRLLLPIAAAIAIAVVLVRPLTLFAPVGPGPSADPVDVRGLRVMSVSEAMTIRDAGVDDREIAVTGWVGPIGVLSCPSPMEGPSSPVEPSCPERFRWVTEAPESLLTVSPNSMTMGPPKGPAISPDFAAVDQSWFPATPANGPGLPVSVVLLGHFDDRRAVHCPAEVRRDCEDRFVVDQVVSAGAAPVGTIASYELGLVQLPDQQPAAALVARVVPDATTLSILAIGRVGIPFVEPSLSPRFGGIVQAALVWRFQVLRGEHASTYLVGDGTTDVIAVADDGTTALVVAPSPLVQPSASPSATPFPVVTVAELIERSTDDPPAEEVMVRGWIARAPEGRFCPLNLEPHPLIPDCLGRDLAMSDTSFVGSVGDVPPDAIVPILGQDAHLELSVPSGEAVEVIAVGHQGDHRWTTCPVAQQTECQGRFVIDRLLPADAIADAPLVPWRMVEDDADATPELDPDEVGARVQAVIGPADVVSIGFVSPGSLIRVIEPQVFVRDRDADALLLLRANPIWIVRAITADSEGWLRTFRVLDTSRVLDGESLDGRSGVSEITATGVVQLQAGPRTLTLDLGPDDGIAPELSRVTVVDRSGQLLTAIKPDDTVLEAIRRETSAAGDGPVWRLRDASSRGRLYVAWEGGMCDRSTVTILAEATSISIDHGPPQACRLALVVRILQLDFFDPDAVDRLALRSALSPIPSADPSWPPALVDGRLAVVGQDGVDGTLTCAPGEFPLEGLAAPTGAEDLLGPEYDALRDAITGIGPLSGGGRPTWRVASRSDAEIVFFALTPEEEFYGLVFVARRTVDGWSIRNSGDCDPRPVPPPEYGPATWTLDPAFQRPTAASRTLHLLVTELACASGQRADDRLSPAFILVNSDRISISIAVRRRDGAQRCPGNPPTAVTVRLAQPIGDRPLVDGNAPTGTAG